MNKIQEQAIEEMKTNPNLPSNKDKAMRMMQIRAMAEAKDAASPSTSKQSSAKFLNIINMKKEFIYFTIALLLFCVGFLIGKTQNDSGRYFLKDYSDGASVFDTSTGIINSYSKNTNKFFKFDIKKGTIEEIKKKK